MGVNVNMGVSVIGGASNGVKEFSSSSSAAGGVNGSSGGPPPSKRQVGGSFVCFFLWNFL